MNKRPYKNLGEVDRDLLRRAIAPHAERHLCLQSEDMGGGGKPQINSIGWHTRVDNNKTNKSQAGLQHRIPRGGGLG